MNCLMMQEIPEPIGNGGVSSTGTVSAGSGIGIQRPGGNSTKYERKLEKVRADALKSFCKPHQSALLNA